MLWEWVAKYAEEREDGDCHLERDSDNEYVLRSMMWADNYWLFCHNRENLGPYGERYHRRTVEPGHGTQAGITMVDELMTREEDKLTLKVGGRGKDWDLPFREVFDVLSVPFST